MEVALASQKLTVAFGASSTAVLAGEEGWELAVAMPVLGPVRREAVFEDAATRRIEGDFHLMESEGVLSGCLVVPGVSGSLEGPVFRAYRDLFRILGTRNSLYRVWNYVPRINAETNGLENYRSFNIGRHRAFEERFGPSFIGRIPAASALGIEDDCFALAFIAGAAAPEFVENPEQVPAYRYPGEYGPKSPTFARGAVVEIGGRRTGFLSGTSSVKGHLTEAAGDFEEQFRITVDNIGIVADAMGFGGALGDNPGCEGHYRFFVRDPAEAVEAIRLFAHLPGSAGRSAIFLRSDICRGDLALEIEAIFRASV